MTLNFYCPFSDFNLKRCLFRTFSVLVLLFIAETVPSFGRYTSNSSRMLSERQGWKVWNFQATATPYTLGLFAFNYTCTVERYRDFQWRTHRACKEKRKFTHSVIPLSFYLQLEFNSCMQLHSQVESVITKMSYS